MNSRSYKPSQTAFTLVELLTVIAIIAILMGLLFPAIGIVQNQARKAEAKTACMNILAAVKAYQTEYGKYPNPKGATSGTPTPGDVIVGDMTAGKASEDNDELFNILRAKPVGVNLNHALNPRRLVFFEGKSVSNSDAPKGGFADSATAGKAVPGAFYDPWGAQYCVVIDADYDNVLDTIPYADFTGATKGPQTGCGVYSLGKDGILGSRDTGGFYKKASSPSDDIISWQ